MSKQKPLPPQKVPLIVKSPPPLKEAPSYKLWAPATFEHRAAFCQADEVAFGTLAATMELDGWELVSTESCQRHVSTANGTGMSHGWMTFWKRIKKETAS